MSTMTETRNETPSPEKDLRQEVSELKHKLELQTATQAGVDATQVATTAGAQATQGELQQRLDLGRRERCSLRLGR